MKKIALILLPAIAMLISCSKESTPDPSFVITITGDGITDSLVIDATSAVGEVNDSIQIIAGDEFGSVFRLVIPQNNITGTYNVVAFFPGPFDGQFQYTPDAADLLKLSIADSGTINITRIDDQGTENLIDGDFYVRTQNLSGDTLRLRGSFVSIPILVE